MNWPLRLRRVEGVSLMPVVNPGQIIIFSHWRRARIGNLILAKTDGLEIVKVVAAERGQSFDLAGYLPGASSYRLDKSALAGVAIWPRWVSRGNLDYNNAYESTRRPVS